MYFREMPQFVMEPGIGFEPTNLLITNQLLYQLSYPGRHVF